MKGDGGSDGVMVRFERGLCPRNRLGGMLERGAKPPFEGNTYRTAVVKG